MAEGYLDALQRRAAALEAEGLDQLHAFGRAHLESLLDQWPIAWGQDFQVLLYGDFRPPEADLDFPSLGIRVLAEPLKRTAVSSAMTVLAARVTISERSVEQVIDAGRRVNVLLGAWTLVTWGNSPIGWWSHISHGAGGSVMSPIDHGELDAAVAGVLALPAAIRGRIDAALYWIREPGRTIKEHHRPDLLRKYVAYWNAFECLVEAVVALRPPNKLTRPQKTRRIAEYLESRMGSVRPQDIEYLYREIVNPGFVGSAKHALSVCFGPEAQRYIEECFTRPEEADRLYNIRNAINHGEVDAENPDELLRIQSRMGRLFMIVWGMFGRLIRFPCPVDRPKEL